MHVLHFKMTVRDRSCLNIILGAVREPESQGYNLQCTSNVWSAVRTWGLKHIAFHNQVLYRTKCMDHRKKEI